MTLTWFTFMILATATFRLTRLVVDDTITQPIRTAIEIRATVKLRNAASTWLEVDQERPWFWRKMYALTSCHWCVSIWMGALVVALWHYQRSWFQFVCYVLALSTVSGLGTRLG